MICFLIQSPQEKIFLCFYLLTLIVWSFKIFIQYNSENSEPELLSKMRVQCYYGDSMEFNIFSNNLYSFHSVVTKVHF